MESGWVWLGPALGRPFTAPAHRADNLKSVGRCAWSAPSASRIRQQDSPTGFADRVRQYRRPTPSPAPSCDAARRRRASSFAQRGVPHFTHLRWDYTGVGSDRPASEPLGPSRPIERTMRLALVSTAADLVPKTNHRSWTGEEAVEAVLVSRTNVLL